MVVSDPHISIRKLSEQSGMSFSTVYRALHEQKYHSYVIQTTQELYEEDEAARADFCRVNIDKI